MELSEINSRRDETERAITRLLADFEQNTETKIGYLRIERYDTPVNNEIVNVTFDPELRRQPLPRKRNLAEDMEFAERHTE